MKSVGARIFGARLPEQVYCLIRMTQQEMAQTQCRVMARECLVVWIKPDGFFYVGDSCFWLTQPHPRLPKLEKCAGVTAVERNRSLELHLRLAQSALHSPDYPHRNMCHRMVRIALESFET